MTLKKRLTAPIAVFMCLMIVFAYTDVSSAGTSRARVKGAVISKLKLEETDDGNVVITWSRASGKCRIKQYEIYAEENGSGKYRNIDTVTISKKKIKNSSCSYVDDSGYSVGDVLKYKVRGKKKVNGKVCYTKFSLKKKITIRYGENVPGGKLEAKNVKYHTAKAVDDTGKEISYEGKSVTQRKYVESFDRQDPLVKSGEKLLHYTDISSGNQIDMTDAGDLKKLFSTKITGSKGSSVGTLQENWAVVADGIMEKGGKCACQEDCDYETLCTGKANYRLDLDKDLAATDSAARGDRGLKCCMRSGLCYGSSLAQVRDQMRDQVVDLVDSAGLRSEKDLIMGVGNCRGKNKDVLAEIKDSTNRPVIYTIASACDSRRGSCDYDYASFGLIFYDFSLTPIVDKNIDHLSSADGFKNADIAKQCGASGLSMSAKPERVDKSVTNEGTTMSRSEVDYTVGTNQTMTLSQSNSSSVKTTHAANIKLGFSEKWTDFFSTTQSLSYGFTYENLFSTTDGKSKSITTSESKSAKVSTDVPAHTYKEMYVVKTVSNSEDSQRIPMELKYKVAVVSFSGQVNSNSSHAYVRTVGYDHANYTTEFGVGDDAGKAKENGYDARESLNKRAVVYGNDRAFEKAAGEVHKFYFVFVKWGHDVFDDHGCVEWNSMSGQTKKAVANISENVPILSNAANMKIDTTKFDFTVRAEIPLYQMTKVYLVPRGVHEKIVDTLTLNVGDDKNLYNSGVRVQGYDNGGPKKQYAPFNAFSQRDGSWIECDKYGNVLKESEKTGVFRTTNRGGNVEALKPGTGYVIWGLSEDKSVRSKFNTKEKPDGTSVNAWETKGPDDAVIDATGSVVKIVVK